MAIVISVVITNLLLACVVLVLAKKRVEGERDSLRERYGGIADVDAAKAEVEREVERMGKRRAELSTLLVREEGCAQQQAFGVYEPQYDFAGDAEYENALKAARNEQRELAAGGKAVVCQGGKAAASPEQADLGKLMLHAFNGQAEATIAAVMHSKVVDALDRLHKLFAVVNGLGLSGGVQLRSSYLELKEKELKLVHERAAFQERQREAGSTEQRDHRREERVRAKELADAERLLAINQESVQTLEREIGEAAEADKDRLQKRLEEARTALESSSRTVAQARPPRAGYVYVLSNVGSFGENIFAIGMTRRLQPQKRVGELGDAAVPFPFDVHAMIYSPDAPALKASLQQALDGQRVNLVNRRKDFFRASLDDIEAALSDLDLSEPILSEPEAREYHESVAQGGGSVGKVAS